MAKHYHTLDCVGTDCADPNVFMTAVQSGRDEERAAVLRILRGLKSELGSGYSPSGALGGAAVALAKAIAAVEARGA